MPNNASLGAGVLQWEMRLSVPIGLSITTVAFTTTMAKLEPLGDVMPAYRSAFYCTIAFAALSILFIPFMDIPMQGVSSPANENENENAIAAEACEAIEMQSIQRPVDYQDRQCQTSSSISPPPADSRNATTLTGQVSGTCDRNGSLSQRVGYENDAESIQQTDGPAVEPTSFLGEAR